MGIPLALLAQRLMGVQPRRDSSLVIVTRYFLLPFGIQTHLHPLQHSHTAQFVAALCSPELFLDTSHEEEGPERTL